MTVYLEIAVNVPQVSGVFHYHLPAELEGRVSPGHLVVVPFGRQEVQGVVLREVAQPAVQETKSVRALVDPTEVVTPAQVALAEYLAHTTPTALADWIGLMLPAGLSQHAETTFDLASGWQQFMEDHPESLSDVQRKVIGLLQKRGALRSGQLERALPRQNWRGATDSLLRMGILTSRVELPGPGVRPKTIRTAQLGCSPEQASAALLEIGKPGSAASLRRQAILRYLLAETGPTDVAWVYAQSGGNSNDLRYLEQRGLVVLGESEVWRDPLEQIDYHPSYPLSLTRDQQAVWVQVQEQMQRVRAGESARPMLLFGVTGSGKTELYLRAVAEALDNGQQAIVLVPEIALTPQTVRRFLARFPGRVGLLHSGLSDGERYDTWRRARAGSLSVVVGPRSALFTPFSQLGLIVVDECHDDSYYQPDPPFYHAREVAAVYARLANAVCLLGSATPDITSTYQVQKGNWLGLSLPERILAHRDVVQAQLARLAQEHGGAQTELSSYRPYEQEAETTDLPLVQVVDLREELKAGNRSIFSRLLQTSLEQVLTRGQQAILFLNRLGAATYVFCRDCGFVLKCPRCDMPLTYHENAPLRTPQDKPILLCHHCGYRRQMPAQCPKCGSSRVRQYGSGTERVQSEVQALFPEARTLRWDFTTTRKKGAHDVILSHFVAHRADILIGTQMLAKGLDLPFVTLVGAILADVGLSLPDYRAGERTFQVLTQVAGRAGRSPLGGQVILQTFQPESYVIQAAAKHAYGQFYEQELDYRRTLGYPPFTNMVRLEFRHHDSERAERTAQQLGVELKKRVAAEDRRATQIIGPAPAFFARVGGLYRWQLIIKGPEPLSLLKQRPLPEWRIELNPPNLL